MLSSSFSMFFPHKSIIIYPFILSALVDLHQTYPDMASIVWYCPLSLKCREKIRMFVRFGDHTGNLRNILTYLSISYNYHI